MIGDQSFAVRFEITGVAVSCKMALELSAKNGDKAENNFCAMVDAQTKGVLGSVSILGSGTIIPTVDATHSSGGNSGLWKMSQLNSIPNVEAHEYGYGIGWFDANSRQWGYDSNGDAKLLLDGTHDYIAYIDSEGRSATGMMAEGLAELSYPQKIAKTY